MYLLSQYGERHEDRLPEGIFSSLEKIKEFLTVTDSFVSERLVATDYDNSAVELILFYSSEEEFDKLSEEEKGKVEFEWYIAEQFELDNIESETIKSKPGEISPIENFKDSFVRHNYKLLILESIELAQRTDIRGINPFLIRTQIGKGTELQIRELLFELETTEEIIFTGSTRDKKYSLVELSDKAKAQYEKECDERKLRWNQ
jgi:hypothetical protein